MGKNNRCTRFCVCVMIFAQIAGGLTQVLLLMLYSRQIDKLDLMFGLIVSKLTIASGVVLCAGVRQRNVKAVRVHIINTVFNMSLTYAGFTVKLFLVTIEAATAIAVFCIFEGIFIFLAVMEYAVYLFHKNMKKEIAESVADV